VLVQSTAYLVLVLAMAAVFYGGIPGVGAFLVRAKWRRFRSRLTAASLLDFARYSDLNQRENGPVGQYRFLGRLEAIQDRNRVWLTNGRFSVAADLEDLSLYVLPSSSSSAEGESVERYEQSVPDEEPRSIRWRRIFSLPQGTRLFVAGTLMVEDGRGVFRSTDRERLVVVIYDGEADTLLQRAVWAGRQRNEYWNQYTLASLLVGSFSLLLAAFVLLRDPHLRIPVLFALTACTFPVASVLPPGLVLYFPYRSLWKRARLLRAERDLLRLPLRYFDASESQETAKLPTGEEYAQRVGSEVRCEGEVRIRQTRLGEEVQGVPYTYGVPSRPEAGGEILRKPEDPMAELIRIPGNPAVLSNRCASRARLLEVLSGAFVVVDIGFNLFLVLLVLSQII
jgi:hypothetical protein